MMPCMIISCPKCETQFIVEDAKIGETGRKVRCGKCAHTWHQMLEKPEDKKPPASQDEAGLSAEEEEDYAAFARKLNDTSVPTVTDKKYNTAWLKVASILLFIAALGGTLLAFEPTLRHAGLGGLYNAIGMEEMPGLEVQNVSIFQSPSNNKLSLTISGEVTNTGEEVQPMPVLYITIADSKGDPNVLAYRFDGKETLHPEENVSFQPKINNIPLSANAVYLDIGGNVNRLFRSYEHY